MTCLISSPSRRPGLRRKPPGFTYDYHVSDLDLKDDHIKTRQLHGNGTGLSSKIFSFPLWFSSVDGPKRRDAKNIPPNNLIAPVVHGPAPSSPPSAKASTPVVSGTVI